MTVKGIQGYCLPMGAANYLTQATMFDSTPTTVPATECQHGQPDQQARDSWRPQQ